MSLTGAGRFKFGSPWSLRRRKTALRKAHRPDPIHGTAAAGDVVWNDHHYGVPAAPAFVLREDRSTAAAGGNVASQTQTLGIWLGKIAVGQILHLWVLTQAANASPALATVTDSNGHTWTKRTEETDISGPATLSLHTTTVTTEMDSSDLITVSLSDGVDRVALRLVEFSPTAITTTEDVADAGADNGGVTSTTPSAGPITPPSAAAFVIGAVGLRNGSIADVFNQDTDTAGGSGWTSMSATGEAGIALRLAYKITTSSAAQTYNPTLGTARHWAATVAAFQIPAGGGTVTFDLAVAGTGSVSVANSVTRDLATTVAGTGALAVGAAAVTRGLAANIAGVGALTLDYGYVRLFQLAVAGVGTVAMDASATRPLNVTIAGSGAVATPLSVTRPLGLPIAGVGTVATPLAVTRPLDMTVAGTSAVAIDMSLVKLFALAIAGTSTVDIPTLAVTRGLNLNVAGVGTLTVANSVIRGLAASIAGTGAVTMDEAVTRALALVIAGAGAVVQDFDASSNVTLAMNVAGQGAVTVGALAEQVTLALAIAGAGQVAPSLTVTRPETLGPDYDQTPWIIHRGQ